MFMKQKMSMKQISMKQLTGTAKYIAVLFGVVLVLAALLLPLASCSVIRKEKPLNIPVHMERKNLDKASILVFNFHEPEHARGEGAYVAERFHLNLLKSKKFRVASLFNDSPWNRIATAEEERLMLALEEGRKQKFDYILVGRLIEFFDGGATSTRVQLKVRIIEVSSRTTIFLAEHGSQAKSKDPSYPIATKLSRRATHPRQLAEKLIKEVIRKI